MLRNVFFSLGATLMLAGTLVGQEPATRAIGLPGRGALGGPPGGDSETAEHLLNMTVGKLQTNQTLQELERLVELREFDKARPLMARLLEVKQAAYERTKHEEDPINGLDDIELFASNIPPLLEKRSGDDLYNMHEAEVRAELATRVHARNYAESDGLENARVHDELVAVVERHFEIKLAIREAEVKRLEVRVAGLRAKFDRRKELAKEIINRRINELMGKPDMLRWDESAESLQEVNLRTVIGHPIQVEHQGYRGAMTSRPGVQLQPIVVEGQTLPRGGRRSN